LKTTACILLLAAAMWAQQVAVPQGGSLGPSCNLSDAASLGADKLDGSHGSTAAAPNAVPLADSNGKIAAGWIPLPTSSSLGGVFMDADCLAGNHVNGIEPASGQLKCTADTGGLGGTVTQNKLLKAGAGNTAADSAMTETAGTDVTSTLKLRAPSFEGTATSDQSLILPAVTSETVSAAGQAKLIAKNNQLMLSVNGGAFAPMAANTPPGSNMQVPFNDNGAWGYLAGFTLNKTTSELAVPGPVTTTGTSQIDNISETTCTAASASKGKQQWNSSTHRPCYSYNAGTPSDVVLQADASVTSSANKIIKQDINGKLDAGLLPAPSASTLGGVTSKAAETDKFLTSIGTDGIPTLSTLPAWVLRTSADALVSADGSTVSPVAPRRFGCTNQTTGEACSLEMGDQSTGFLNGFNQLPVFYGYHGFVFQGNRGVDGLPAFLVADASDNADVTILGTKAASTMLRLKAAPSATAEVFQVQNSSAGNLFKVAADGTATMGSGTGGTLTIGTINASGLVTASGGILPGNTTAPTCDASQRGVFWYVPGAAGVKDTVEVCAKDASNVYAWRAIY
jgi:hypothetical protein